MKKYYLLGTCMIFIIGLIIQSSLYATTIIPAKNLGHLAKSSPIVVIAKAVKVYDYKVGETTFFRTDFIVSDHIKGRISSNFTIQKMAVRIDDLENRIAGEPDFDKGRTYLLYLEEHAGLYRPILLSYGIYFKEEKGGEELLVPLLQGMNEFNLYNTKNADIEPFYVYDYSGLKERLVAVTAGKRDWSSEDIRKSYDPKRFSINTRETPGHCTYLGGTAPHPRWQNFETTSLPVFYHEDGDTSCTSPTNVFSSINSAISNMNTSYQGINLVSSGTHSFIPNCTSGTAQSGNFTGSRPSRSLTIMFGDPCDQIPNPAMPDDPTTLAIGGTYWFTESTHTWAGMEWDPAVWGYVVVNDVDIYCNQPDNYTTMMIHEMTHALGFGHIDNSSGIANMNELCCNDISNLDIACLDYSYLESTLPVDLLSFDGELLNEKVILEWETSNELNNDYFVIERSLEEGAFRQIGTIEANGGDNILGNYELIDYYPGIGDNTYRLIQVDLDGRRNNIGDYITLTFTNAALARMFPNPVRQDQVNIDFYAESAREIDLQLIDAAGRIISNYNISAYAGGNRISLDIGNLPEGIYYLLSNSNLKLENRKLIKL